MAIKDKILIIEDENNISTLMSTVLGANGYDVLAVKTGEDALSMISSHCPDLIILDLGLPDMDGMEIIRQVRAWTMTPIVVVSARTYETDKVDALDAGADDYLTKPFGTGELLARVRTALRHNRTIAANRGAGESEMYKVGDLVIDYAKHQVMVNGENVHLTQNEFKIVSILGKAAGRVLTYDTILRELWGPGAHGSNQILRVNMANIRRKIEKNPAKPQYIFTEVGVGYRMAEDENSR
ncbi:MAG: response regulator transcription factor [Oscillospiraceae bacterium]|nr:response regulator transcription factor [Oscillospiraceae bacterium]